jgi:hypothetical protein
LKLLAAVLLLAAASLVSSAYAQIPIPPPFPGSGNGEVKIAENDRTPPHIEILTDKLTEGKNVFQVRITDDSSLRIREVKFVQNGQLKTEGLFKDQNDVYKALIDVHPPSRVVMVTAGDANGNIATAFKEYDIAPSQDFLSQIIDMLSQIPKYIQNIVS